MYLPLTEQSNTRQAGHKVVGSIRSPSKGTELLSIHPEWEGKVSFVTVPDYAKLGTWDNTFREHDLDYVVHVAAPLLDNPKNVDFDKHFLEPSVKGYHLMISLLMFRNTELLESASKYGKNVNHISVTGSVNAMTMGMPEELKDHLFTTKDYNNVLSEVVII
jgi:nucleoside-diphosphate-sugar epimerase